MAELRALRRDARERAGGDNPVRRLKWLLSFAQDKDSAVPELAIIEAVSFVMPCDESRLLDPFLEFTPATIRNAAEQVRTAIDALRAGREWESERRAFVKAAITADGRRYYRNDFMKIDVAESFLAAALDLLIAERARIRVCAWPDCERLFVKSRRAEYCARHGSAKARYARWRAKKSNSEFSDWRHDRYEAKVHARHPHLKVRRRRPGVATAAPEHHFED